MTSLEHCLSSFSCHILWHSDYYLILRQLSLLDEVLVKFAKEGRHNLFDWKTFGLPFVIFVIEIEFSCRGVASYCLIKEFLFYFDLFIISISIKAQTPRWVNKRLRQVSSGLVFGSLSNETLCFYLFLPGYAYRCFTAPLFVRNYFYANTEILVNMLLEHTHKGLIRSEVYGASSICHSFRCFNRYYYDNIEIKKKY